MAMIVGLFDALLILYAFISGVILSLIYLGVPFERMYWVKLFNTFMNSPHSDLYLLVSALVFLLLAYVSVVFRRMRSWNNSDIFYSSSSGNTIQISNKAITEFISKIVNSFDGVHSAKVRVFTGHNRMKVTVKIDLSIWEGTSYPVITEGIQEQIRSKVEENMGVKNIHSIPISLSQIVSTDTATLPPEEEIFIEE